MLQKLYADPIIVSTDSTTTNDTTISNTTATLTMCLPTGSYATVVLREIFRDNTMV